MTLQPNSESSRFLSRPDLDQSYFKEQSLLGSQGSSSVTLQLSTDDPTPLPGSDSDQPFFKAWSQRGRPVTPRPSADSHKPPPSSDGDQPFFRPWALRGSHRDSSEEISPGTSPTSGFLSKQRKARKSDQNRLGSEHSSSPASFSSDLSKPIPRHITASSLLEIDSKPLKSQISSDSIISRNSTSTRNSVISSRTRNLSRATKACDIPSTGEGKRPSRGPRPGYKWYKGVTGAWIEVKIRLKYLSERSSEKVPTIRVSEEPQRISEKLHHHHSTDTMLEDQRSSKTLNSRPDLPRLPSGSNLAVSASSIPVPKEGLYLRTKRRLGLKKLPKQSNTDETVGHRSFTGDLLYETSRVLHEGARKPSSTSLSVSTSTSDLSIAGEFHRRPTISSKKLNALASSVRDLVGGRAPFPSPNPEAFYTGSDNQQHFIVEMSHPNAPNFLPSEARRVGTPPLPTANSVKCGRMRGFFFDYNAPGDDTNLSNGGIPRSPVPGKPSTPDPERESDWFRTQVILAEHEDRRNKFELNVPEHLPNSPLCPKHPKHPSGGRGVCVYHGRNVGSKGTL